MKRDDSEVMRAALVRIAMGVDGAQKIADDALAEIRSLPAAEPADAGRDVAGWISQSTLDAMNKCRDDDYIGYVEIWMRPSEAYSIPLYTRPPIEAAAVDDPVRAAGQRLSNIAFNLAQCKHLPADDTDMLDRARKDWDAALASQQAVKP